MTVETARYGKGVRHMSSPSSKHEAAVATPTTTDISTEGRRAAHIDKAWSLGHGEETPANEEKTCEKAFLAMEAVILSITDNGHNKGPA